MTSFNSPTTTIQELLSNEPDWYLVVVADQKSPSSWPDLPRTVFLDIRSQRELGFHSFDHTPFNHYARKNLGYLYAIKHGAIFIYDTDDDNNPIRPLSSLLESEKMVFVKETMNPYAYFGEATIWPRGYPLSMIGAQGTTFGDARTLSDTAHLPSFPAPLVRQGLANGDPDVDAIFRLTRKIHTHNIEVTFSNDRHPLAFTDGALIPYNSQSTMFTYDALWATVLPTNTTFRICDIWRSYWAQRVMLEIQSATVSFHSPIVNQSRNAHSYTNDFAQEIDMYLSTERLHTFLKSWKPRPTALTIQEIGLDLARDMAHQGFWTHDDVKIIEMFFEDLVEIGYTFPQRRQNRFVSVEEQPLTPMRIQLNIPSSESTTTAMWDYRNLQCSISTKWKDALQRVWLPRQEVPDFPLRRIFPFLLTEKSVNFTLRYHWPFPNRDFSTLPSIPPLSPRNAFLPTKILFVVNFHYSNLMASSNFLLNHVFKYYYNTPFDVVFLAPRNGDESAGILGNGQPQAGWFSYRSMDIAMQKYPDYDGYFLVNDDVILLQSLFHRDRQDLPWDKPWLMISGLRSSCSHMGLERLAWEEIFCEGTIESFLEVCGDEYIGGDCGQIATVFSQADAFFISKSFMPQWRRWSDAMIKNHAFLELAVGTILSALTPFQQPTDPNHPYLCTDWSASRYDLWMNLVNTSSHSSLPDGSCYMYHPIKFSIPVIKVEVEKHLIRDMERHSGCAHGEVCTLQYQLDSDGFLWRVKSSR